CYVQNITAVCDAVVIAAVGIERSPSCEDAMGRPSPGEPPGDRKRENVGLRCAEGLAINDGAEARIQPRQRAVGCDEITGVTIDVSLRVEVNAVRSQVIGLYYERAAEPALNAERPVLRCRLFGIRVHASDGHAGANNAAAWIDLERKSRWRRIVVTVVIPQRVSEHGARLLDVD